MKVLSQIRKNLFSPRHALQQLRPQLKQQTAKVLPVGRIPKRKLVPKVIPMTNPMKQNLVATMVSNSL